MPGLTAPSDYSEEPPRHPSLQVNAKEPFNAEPPRSTLIQSYVTPVEFFYKRNHGPIPTVDVIENYCVSVCGLFENPKDLFMTDIRYGASFCSGVLVGFTFCGRCFQNTTLLPLCSVPVTEGQQ